MYGGYSGMYGGGFGGEYNYPVVLLVVHHNQLFLTK